MVRERARLQSCRFEYFMFVILSAGGNERKRVERKRRTCFAGVRKQQVLRSPFLAPARSAALPEDDNGKWGGTARYRPVRVLRSRTDCHRYL
jgi:hypothetical protein